MTDLCFFTCSIEYSICSICKCVFKDPVKLECDHSFCRECIDKAWNSLQKVRHCPYCESEVGGYVPNTILGKTVNKVKMHIMNIMLNNAVSLLLSLNITDSDDHPQLQSADERPGETRDITSQRSRTPVENGDELRPRRLGAKNLIGADKLSLFGGERGKRRLNAQTEFLSSSLQHIEDLQLYRSMGLIRYVSSDSGYSEGSWWASSSLKDSVSNMLHWQSGWMYPFEISKMWFSTGAVPQSNSFISSMEFPIYMKSSTPAL